MVKTTKLWGPSGAILLMITVAFSGCFGSDSPNDAATVAAPAEPASFDETTGGIEGTVLDDESVTVAGVEVGIPSLDLLGTTDANGAFSFSNVPPGTHAIFASKLGYEPVGQNVEVIAGEVKTVQLVVVPTMAPDAVFHFSEELRGFMNCGLGLVVLLLTSRCTGDTNHRVHFDFNVTADIQTVIGEMVWQPTSGFSSGSFILDLWQNTNCPNCDPDYAYGESEGPSPLIVRADTPFKGVKDAAETPEPDQSVLTWQIWTPGTQDNVPIIVIVLNQPYTIWSSTFYGEPAAEGFTALPT